MTTQSVPTKILAGVTVPDTPLITKALECARLNLNDVTYNHVVRSWLFGVFIAGGLPALREHDTELLAIAASKKQHTLESLKC